MTYRVWDPNNCDEDGAREIEAHSRSEAAQDFAEDHDRDDWHDGDIRVYRVRDTDGRLWSVEVMLEMVPSYRTSEPERVEEPQP